MFRYAIAFLLLPALSLAQVSSYTITTVVGVPSAIALGDGGPPLNAYLNTPIALWVDASHNLFIADSADNRIREAVLGSKITTVAGSGTPGFAGDGGAASSANLYAPYRVIFDSSGNMYISDLANQVVRMVNKSGVISTYAGNNGYGSGFGGDGGAATNAVLKNPFGLAFDSAGNLYIADSANNRIRMVTPNGIISTVAGNGNAAYSGDGGPAIKAALNQPFGIAFDPNGNLYIADSANNRIRMVAPNGIISTVAGNGKNGYTGDGILAVTAELNRPFDVAFDAYGNLFIADCNNFRVREVTTNGMISTIGGGTGVGYSGDGFIGSNSKLNSPTGLAVDSSGNIYIADSGNNVIRMLTPYVPFVNPGGVLSAGAFGGFTSVAPGSWIEIYGSNLSSSARSWTAGDFTGGGLIAPTSLDSVSVTIGGQPAFVDYISGGQINAQVPYTVAAGQQPLIVKTAAGATVAAYSVTLNAVQPGMFAPPLFDVNGTQYVGAQFSDGTYALPPGAVAGISSRPAKAGDAITIYGVGFGPVTPGIPAGQIVQQSNPKGLPSFQISIAGTPAAVTYAGLAPNAIGLYQFNVVVPSVGSSDVASVTFSVNGTSGTQTLHIPVQ